MPALRQVEVCVSGNGTFDQKVVEAHFPQLVAKGLVTVLNYTCTSFDFHDPPILRPSQFLRPPNKSWEFGSFLRVSSLKDRIRPWL
jgi:hypothetical protein